MCEFFLVNSFLIYVWYKEVNLRMLIFLLWLYIFFVNKLFKYFFLLFLLRILFDLFLFEMGIKILIDDFKNSGCK